MDKYKPWLDKTKVDSFFKQFVKNLREEGNRRFKKTTVTTKTFSSMEVALASFNKRGGPQPEDFCKKGSVKQITVEIFDPVKCTILCGD